MPACDVHPYYARRYPYWQKARAAYIGGEAWYNQGETYQLGPYTVRAATPGKTGLTYQARELNRLWRHEREKDIRYARRLRMSAYENVFRPQIDQIAAAIAASADSLTLPDTLEYLRGNTDRWGLDEAAFRFRRIAWSHVFGHIYTLLEKPEAGQQPSRLHELAAGIRTYFQIVTPLDLLDWRWNPEAMEFEWAKVRVARPLERTAPDEPKAAEAEQCLWTKLYKPGEWILYRDGKEYDRGKGPDFVPLTVQFAVGQDPAEAEPVGIPINDDAADLAELRFNKQSWLTDIEASQCFSQAHIKTTTGVLDDETEQALGIHTYVGADHFAWVTPSMDPATHLMASMERDASSMRQMRGVETKGETSEAAKSGLALELEQQNVSSLFTGYAAAARSGEETLYKMAAVLENVDPGEVVAVYADDFSAYEAISQRDTVVLALQQGGFTGTAKAELQKRLWLAANPDAEEAIRDKVFAEIDAEVVAEKDRKAAMADSAVALANGMGETEETEPPEDESNGATKLPAFTGYEVT